MSTEKKPLNVQIGARIKQAREQAHVTQERLAEQIEVSVQYISDLERGKVGASVSTVIKICQTLQVSCDYLLLGVEPTGSIYSPVIPADLTKEQERIVREGILLLLRAMDFINRKKADGPGALPRSSTFFSIQILLILFHIQHPGRVQHGQDHDADIRKDAPPHVGDAQRG